MNASDIKVTKTPPEIFNTLPNIYPTELVGYAFRYDLGKIKDKKLSLCITPEYIIFKNDLKNVLYKLSSKSIYTIHTTHNKIQNYQLFHWGIEKEVEEFKKLFIGLNLKNYPLPIFPAPTFNQVYPCFEELFNLDARLHSN